MKNVHTYTFGCKVNYFDTTQLEAVLENSGAVVDHARQKSPDTIVVNTCTVTESADKQANQLIRKLKKEHPQAQIVVTGCYTQQKDHQLASMQEIDVIVDMKDQLQMPSKIGWAKARTSLTLPIVTTHRTRANVKIQDGCQAYCTYCILPYVRGKSRSIQMDHIIKQVASFVEEGHQEIIVTGTHIAGYGRDFTERKRLSDLLYAIYQTFPKLWIRVSSLEPVGVTPDFIKAVKQIPTIRPHFHIPLQSGCDKILKAMNRKYKTKHYQERIKKLHATNDAVSIGTDVIVGFPGETKDDFEETFSFIQNLPLSYLHVFPYSSRPGTKSASFEETVSPEEKKERVQRLLALSKKKKMHFLSGFDQKNTTVIVEKKRTEDGYLKGVSPHWISVRFKGDDRLMAKEIEVNLASMAFDTKDDPYFVGRVL
ncbi:MAG: tRNA (N(6)-L-threonylcarbamoyladenosine(37)-C(2))-methylthiotransferase MtaB [Bdellovibrionales bacterium]|nr:tRNA (N(6)-L-threonylcarbamoyladenosine(37)-C(2))-methylthiotransferase MtaB [Bdellovibrionales bacterium]